MIKLKDNVTLEDLKKYGFNENGIFSRVKDDIELYRVVVTKNHKYLQIRSLNCYGYFNIAGSLQDLIFDLIKNDLVEKVEK